MKRPVPKLSTQISGGDGQFDRRVGAVCPLLAACRPGPFGGQDEDGCAGGVAVGGQPTGLSLKDFRLIAKALEKSSCFTARNRQRVSPQSSGPHLCEPVGLWSQGHSTARLASRTDQGRPQVGGDRGGRMGLGFRTWVGKLVTSEGSCSVTCRHWGVGSAAAWRPWKALEWQRQ